MKLNLRQRLKYFIFNFIPGFQGKYKYFDTTVYFPLNSHIFQRLCREGVYESKNISLILKFLPKDGVLFDVGANIGLIAVPILKNRSDVTIVSFEASPNSLPYLLRSAASSPFSKRWEVRQTLLGSKVGETQLWVNSSAEGVFDSLLETNRGEGHIESVTLPISTLDQEWKALGKPKVSLIKIDVEGAEADVIDGARECIETTKPYLLVEWSRLNLKDEKHKIRKLMDMAFDLGHEVFTVPELLHVPNATVLNLYMRRADYFLLIPKY